MTVKTYYNTSEPEARRDIDENRIISAIGYIGVLFLLPLLMKRDSDYAQYHGKQGLALFLAWTINSVIAIVPIIGWTVAFFGSILLLVLSFLGILKAYAGEYWEMPFVRVLSKKLNLD